MYFQIIKILLSVILIPTYYTYIISKTFNSVYINNIDVSSLAILPINFECIIDFIKLCFPISIYISTLILAVRFLKPYQKSKNPKNNISHYNKNHTFNDINLFVGTTENNEKIFLSDSSLYQNILITGAIGSGKTSCAVYPFLKQLLCINNICGLILDVKGNMKPTITKICDNNRLIIIELLGKYKYNPLHKPKLKPYMLADRLVTILKLFSNTKSTDTYWFDKARSNAYRKY